jgi:hypothetical protein
MTKHKPSPSKVEDREQHFKRLLAAMYTSEAPNPFTEGVLIGDLEQIEKAYRVAVSGKQPDRRLVSRYRAAIAKVLTLSEKIGPHFFGDEIQKAGLLQLNPDIDDSMLLAVIEERRHDPDRVVEALTSRVSTIDHWFKTSGDTYRKRDVTKLVVEPFLRLMTKYAITTSRRQQPRKRIFDALFDWIGVEKKFRPSDASINLIARGLEGSGSSSESNAKRRTKN